MTETEASPRRRGRRGRTDGSASPHPDHPARQAPEGGRYRPLDEDGVAAIHRVALDLLADVGLSGAPPEVAELVVAAGGIHGADGRLRFPSSLVERALAGMPRGFSLHARRPDAGLTLEGARVHMGSGGAAPHVVDLDSGAYRPSSLRDLYDAARLVDTLGHASFFSRSLVARDMPDEHALDINTAYAALAGTSKHVLVSASRPEHVADIAAMCHMIAGSPEAFRARPFLSLNVNHAVPPMRLDAEACRVLLEAARLGVPVQVNTFGQLGASSPVTVAGCVAQTVAETLAGMIIVWAADPSARAVFGPRPMITDLRTGAMAGGSGEQALLTAAAVQMARHYDLPSSTIAGATDAKLADNQAGYEKALAIALAAQAGCNMITQACGMQAGLMAAAFESYLIDDDMMGSILRALAPVELGAGALSVDAIRDVVLGDGHFLGHPETFRRMESDFFYPALADRRTPEAWAEAGSPDIRDTARARARETLSRHYPDHLPAGIDGELRARFDIRLPRRLMRPQ